MTNGNGRDGGHAGGSAAMTAEQFGAYMEKRLTLYDEVELLDREGMELRLRVNGADVAADLGNFYNAYRRDPAQLDAVVQTFAKTLLGIHPDRSTSNYAELSSQIYPLLKPIILLSEVRERKLPMLAYREFLADLMIAYVIDEEHSFAYINEDHLERWNISVQDLHEQALANLRRRTDDRVKYTTVGEGEQRLFIFNSGDGYDATRLLLADVLAAWSRELPGHLVVGIPNRDFLIAFSDANSEILRAVAAQVQSDAVQREYGLTEQLFTLADGVIKEYAWE
jgi:uncharacterized protein YtpQ (UPF0354 family)